MSGLRPARTSADHPPVALTVAVVTMSLRVGSVGVVDGMWVVVGWTSPEGGLAGGISCRRGRARRCRWDRRWGAGLTDQADVLLLVHRAARGHGRRSRRSVRLCRYQPSDFAAVRAVLPTEGRCREVPALAAYEHASENRDGTHTHDGRRLDGCRPANVNLLTAEHR
jgi:hypothetical protein